MKTGIVGVVVWLVSMNSVFASCDLTRFRFGCDLPAHTQPKPYVSSVVYCANMPVYVTRAQYDAIVRYQRTNVRMDMMVNGEFVQGPCIPEQP